jgi:hypothetical protein
MSYQDDWENELRTLALVDLCACVVSGVIIFTLALLSALAWGLV